MQKFLDFTLNRTFAFWALVGGGAAFAAQVILLGDMPFLLFWLLNVGAAGVVGSVGKWVK